MTENVTTLTQNEIVENNENNESEEGEIEVLFYSLFDISHEKGKSSPIFFHMKSTQQLEEDIEDVVMFADKTIEEAAELTKVRNYYFSSENTEVVSQIKKILDTYIREEELTEENILSKLQIISERYSDAEARVTKKTNINTPSPSNLFYVLSRMPSSDESNNFIFFIAKIEKVEFLHSEEYAHKILRGLPHNSEGKKSDKNWKTATIHISSPPREENEIKLEIDQVILSDTNAKISTYWYSGFLESTEVTDDEKNTLQAYNEIKRVINSFNRDKDRTADRQSDINHFTQQLNGYFLKSTEFNYEEMVNSVFGSSYTPNCSTLKMEDVHDKVEKRLKDSTKFDNNFSIIKSIVEDKTKQTYKVSDKIEIRINKHIDGLRDIISSEKDGYGNPYIKIIVDSVHSEAYKNFIHKEQSENNSEQ